jgi:hypothetical protein
MATKYESITIPLNVGHVPNVDPERVEPTQLVSSLNTRLSTTRGRVEKSPGLTGIGSVTLPDLVPYCHGIVPDNDDSACGYFRPKFGHYAIHAARGVVEPVQATTMASPQQNAYVPVSVEESVYLHGATSQGAPSCVHYGVYRLYATIQQANGAAFLCVTVYTSDGDPLYSTNLGSAAAFDITTWNTNAPWIAITQHGDNGVRLWYGVSGDLTMYTLSVTDAAVTIASTAVIWAGVINTFYDVAGDDPSYAWVIARSNGAGVNARLWRIDVASSATVTHDFVNWCSSGAYAGNFGSISHLAIAPTAGGTKESWLLVAVTDSTALTSFAMLDGYAMTLRWAATTGLHFYCASYLATGFYCTGATNAERFGLIFCGTRTGAPGQAAHPRTIIQATDFAATYTTATVHNMVPLGKSNPWIANDNGGTDSEVYPLVQMARSVHDGTVVAGYVWPAPLPNGTPFTYLYGGVDDPAIQVCTVRRDTGFSLASVARLQTDKYPAFALVGPSSCTMHVNNTDLPGSMLCGFAEVPAGQSVITAMGQAAARISRLSLDGGGNSSSSNGIAPTARNWAATLVAAAQPVVWDGLETVEAGPLFRPYIGAAVVAGPGKTGTFRIRAAYVFRDRHGKLHRSDVSEYVEVVLANQEVDILVVMPFTVLDGVRQTFCGIQLYSTNGTDQTTYYEAKWFPTAPVVQNGSWFYGAVATALQYAQAIGNALSYDGTSLGEFSPQPPPALWDAWPVDARVWAVLAEDRHTLWPSKLRDSLLDIAPEFTPFLAQRLPVSAGKIMAVRGLDGVPIFFCEKAIYTIDGQGPDNTGAGQVFDQPRQLSTLGCLSRDSIAVTPAGILFMASSEHPAFISSAGLRVFYEQPVDNARGAAVFLRGSEAVLFGGYGEFAQVYNWEADAWTSWQTVKNLVSIATIGDQHVVGFNTINDGGFNGFLELKDTLHAPSGLSTTVGQMALKTGWLAPAGIAGDVTFAEVWVRCRRVGAHTLKVTVSRDFSSASPYVVTWSDAELQAQMDALGNYVVRVQLGWQCRSIQVQIEETGAAAYAMSPLSITVYHTPESTSQLRALPNGATK